MQFSSEFYKQRLQDRLAVGDRDGDSTPAPPMTAISTEDELLEIADDAEFVRQAYLYFLRREPDLGGLQYFSEAVRSRGRHSVADELRQSAEGREVSGTPRRAAALESAAGDEDAEDLRVMALGRPLELTSLLAIAGDETFVSALYEEVLGRPADTGGLAHHLERLSRGEARESLAKGLALSPEARRMGRPFTWAGQPWPVPSRRDRIRRAVGRVLFGEPALGDEWRAAQTERIAQRIFLHLAFLREAQAEIGRSVAGLERRIEEWRSQAVTADHLKALSADLQSVPERQEAVVKSVKALTGEMTRELARSRQAPLSRTAIVAGDNVVISEVDGFIVGVPGEEWRLAAFHAFRGPLEPGLTRRFAESVAPGMTVVDVGANVGMYTLEAARAVAPRGKVYSFEPTPRTFAILKDNIQVNALLETGLVDCRQVAIADRCGTASLAVYRDNCGHNTLFPRAVSGTEFVEVQTTTLDAALADVARVDVIKIDAEGSEPLVWSGMQQTLSRSPHVRVFMEFAPSLLRRAGQEPGAFIDRLVAGGFRLQRVNDDSGVLEDVTRDQLCAAFSVNLMLTRPAA